MSVGVSFTPPPPTLPYVPFSSGDASTAPVARASGAYVLRRTGPLGVWVATLAVAGSTNTTAEVKLAGATVGTVTLGNADVYEELDLSAVTGTAGQLVVVNVTAVGTDAKGLTVRDVIGHNRDSLADVSPLRQVDRMQVPLLMIQGAADQEVPSEDSRGFAQAMVKAKKELMYISLPQADHYLSRPTDRANVLAKVADFLTTMIPPPAP